MSTVIIIGSDSLRKLDVGGNPIGDGGMSLISNALKDNTILYHLDVEGCGSSMKGNIDCRCYVKMIHLCDFYRCHLYW